MSFISVNLSTSKLATEKLKINSHQANNKMNNSIIKVFILTIFSLQLTAGGGWPQPKGKGYFKLSEWWVVSDQHFTDLGLIDPNVTTGIFNTSIYAEYGLTDRLTTVVYFPFYGRTYQNNIVSGTTGEVIQAGESISGIGDTDIGLKFGLTKPGSGLAISANLTLGLPLGNDSGGSQGALQLGDGEFNQLISIDAGTGWQVGNIPFFANVNVGFNNRTRDFSDEIRFSAEIGANLFNKKLWVIGRLNGSESLKNGLAAANATSIFANNSEYISVGAEMAYNITEKFGVSASYASAVRGEIIFASPSYSVGVFTNF